MKKGFLKKIKRFIRPDSEQGIALIIALMLLSVLSLLGASALLTTNVEVKISGNTRVGRIAFFAADGAGQAAGGILEDCITSVGWADGYGYGAGTAVDDGDFPFEQRASATVPDDSGDLNNDNDVTNAPDITFSGGINASVDVDRGPTLPVAGSSSLTATGYEGEGKGAAGGGTKTVYLFRTKGVTGGRGTSVLFMSYDHYN